MRKPTDLCVCVCVMLLIVISTVAVYGLFAGTVLLFLGACILGALFGMAVRFMDYISRYKRY